MSQEALAKHLHWPSPEEIYTPAGAGARVLVKLAQDKIERELRRKLNSTGVRVGLLTKTPGAVMTASPIAVVCEFVRPISNELLADTHRLAWNFSRAPLLITIEPQLIRTWTCCEEPATNPREISELSFQIREAQIEFDEPKTEAEYAAHALNWVRLATSDFFRQFPSRFRRDGRADRVLLDELKAVRKELTNQKLPDDTIHDLIARMIFIQFLFDRKDSDGHAALNPSLLAKLHKEGTLKSLHTELQTIFSDYNEAYRFFYWLNDKFNGDLFPGKGRSKAARDAEWRAEKSIVKERHLETLAGFVSGTLKLKERQRLLWRHYSFDVIPLEFISSVYEEFVTSNSAHYTPGFLVDFILDGVLPWNGKEWDLKILDPACGSGIFLVKAYQRLIQRWKNAHPGETPATQLLRRILERNLFGVDIDPHAVRVASFSLYLTMCDEVDPKNYLRNTTFPRLRGDRLVHSDFFAEGIEGFDTCNDAGKYDLTIGNAPWGKDTITPAAASWASSEEHNWDVANNAVGTLFMAKAAKLTKEAGRVSMVQPASSLLFNTTGTSVRFRNKFFSRYSISEVVNLSALRFELFGVARKASKSTSPPCIVTFSPTPPDTEPITYICPKNSIGKENVETSESNYTVVVEPSDVSWIYRAECRDSSVWTSLAWGGRRDLALIRKLSSFTPLRELEDTQRIVTRRGVSRGKSTQKRQPAILNMPYVENDDVIDLYSKYLPASELPLNDSDLTHEADSVDMSAFALPQLIVKQSWQKRTSRFKCLIVESDASLGPVFCTRSYFSIHVREGLKLAEQIWASVNSSLAVYFLLLTSGRLSSWIPEPNISDFLCIPVATKSLLKPTGDDYAEIDKKVFRDFMLKDAETVLVEDLFRYTMPDFQGNDLSPGRQVTDRKSGKNVAEREPQLSQYCEYFLRVLKAASGNQGRLCATIFQDTSDNRLPVRLIAFYLRMQREDLVRVETIDSDELCVLLNQLDEKYLGNHGVERGGIFFQRVARIYVEQSINGENTPIVYIVKPDRVRYWTRSAGLRDADEVAADIKLWSVANPPTYEGVEE